MNLKEVKTKNEYAIHLSLRKEVFVDEQGVNLSEEIDDFDLNKVLNHVIHFNYEVNNQIIGTIRVIEHPEYFKIGRIAIQKRMRQKNYGKDMMNKCLTYLQRLNDKTEKYIYLEAQKDVISFYRSLGFEAYGEYFLDCNIVHKKMKRKL